MKSKPKKRSTAVDISRNKLVSNIDGRTAESKYERRMKSNTRGWGHKTQTY